MMFFIRLLIIIKKKINLVLTLNLCSDGQAKCPRALEACSEKMGSGRLMRGNSPRQCRLLCPSRHRLTVLWHHVLGEELREMSVPCQLASQLWVWKTQRKSSRAKVKTRTRKIQKLLVQTSLKRKIPRAVKCTSFPCKSFSFFVSLSHGSQLEDKRCNISRITGGRFNRLTRNVTKTKVLSHS